MGVFVAVGREGGEEGGLSSISFRIVRTRNDRRNLRSPRAGRRTESRTVGLRALFLPPLVSLGYAHSRLYWTSRSLVWTAGTLRKCSTAAHRLPFPLSTASSVSGLEDADKRLHCARMTRAALLCDEERAHQLRAPLRVVALTSSCLLSPKRATSLVCPRHVLSSPPSSRCCDDFSDDCLTIREGLGTRALRFQGVSLSLAPSASFSRSTAQPAHQY